MAYSVSDGARTSQFVLRFKSLVDPGRALSFPCDADGHVDLDALGDQTLDRYLYARTVVGGQLSMPAVVPMNIN